MSRQVKHMYEVVENTTSAEAEVSQFLVQDKHIRKEHEPERVWPVMNIKTGKESRIVGKHIGEYEKVKDYVQGYRDAKHLPEVPAALHLARFWTKNHPEKPANCLEQIDEALAKATGEERA